MPDFYVQASGSPALMNVPWTDPPGITRPSRITDQNDRSYRRINASVGTILTLTAIPNGLSAPEPDSVVGLFTMWAIEYPSGDGMPTQTIPTSGVSAVQTFALDHVGHYTLVVRHERVGSGTLSFAGGFTIVHIESIAT